MKLFNRDGNGAVEIVNSVGIIARDITFDKWEAVIPFGIRDVEAIVGPEVIGALDRFYQDFEVDTTPGLVEALKYLKQSVAFFSWLKLIPTLDAQHDVAGRSRRLGENEKGLTALQEFKDEENILRLAYQAADALVEVLERHDFQFWTSSAKYRLRHRCLIRSKEEFDEYYNIGSHRLFVTLLPVMREMQDSEVAPILGHYIDMLLDGTDPGIAAQLKEPASRALVLLTMQKAVERLPVEVIPEGIVQIQQSQPVKARLKAEQSARASVAASLGNDAMRHIGRLQRLVAELDAKNTPVDRHIPGPIVHTKGLSF